MVILVKFIGNCVCVGDFVCLHGKIMMILSNTTEHFFTHGATLLLAFSFNSSPPLKRSWKTHPHSPKHDLFYLPSESFSQKHFSYTHTGNFCVWCFAVAFMTSRSVYFYFGVFHMKIENTLFMETLFGNLSFRNWKFHTGNFRDRNSN